MCGIIAYLGTAPNPITRVLSAMSKLSYRAPDSTGLAVFGNNIESIYVRKSVGPVKNLIHQMINNNIYADYEQNIEKIFNINSFQSSNISKEKWIEKQLQLLIFESLPLKHFKKIRENKINYISIDKLISISAKTEDFLELGTIGDPYVFYKFCPKSKKDLIELISKLQIKFDISFDVIKQLIKHYLILTINKKKNSKIDRQEILYEFEKVFENLISNTNTDKREDFTFEKTDHYHNLNKLLWEFIFNTEIFLPYDYDRDGVRCIFRLIDNIILTKFSKNPEIIDSLEDILNLLWPIEKRAFVVTWQALYNTEKNVNLYGKAAASAMIWLKQKYGDIDLSKKNKIYKNCKTDPFLLNFLQPPVIGHGRWAIQSPVTVKNAHPFTDSKKNRAIVLNGQFDAEVEKKIEDFLTQVAGVNFKSENSTEYLILLWEYYFNQLYNDQKRYNAIQKQVESNNENYSIGSYSIDYKIYQKVVNKAIVDLDKLAFIEAVKKISDFGGQIAVCGISTLSPCSIYVASHNRPVFIVRTKDKKNVMVVSDLNASYGLFSQEMIKNNNVSDFSVDVFSLEEESLFASIDTKIEKKKIIRSINLTDFNQVPISHLEPFETTINIKSAKKNLKQSFYESHLLEVSNRLSDILTNYQTHDDQLLNFFELNKKVIYRYFGKDLAKLRRLVLVGNGSSYNMGGIAKTFMHQMLPGIDSIVLTPQECDNIFDILNPHNDLVILLSWSSTNADMIKFARLIKNEKIIMITLTEKTFGDLALISNKSGGIISLFTGDELSVSAVKSSFCMLFVLHLLITWITQRRYNLASIEALNIIKDLPVMLNQIVNDVFYKSFSEKVIGLKLKKNVAVIFASLNDSFLSKELALKIEEQTWSVMAKVLDYTDCSIDYIKNHNKKSSFIILATNKKRLDEVIDVIKKFYYEFIDFTLITFSNDRLKDIKKYTRNNYIILPKVDDILKPFIELFFYYRLAFDYKIAHGIGKNEYPRNRAKSVTVTRSLPEKIKSPSEELMLLKSFIIESKFKTHENAITTVSRWEKSSENVIEQNYYKSMRNLCKILLQENPLKDIFDYDSKSIENISTIVFDNALSAYEIVIIPFDREADAASKNFASIWQKLLKVPVRVAFQLEDPSNFHEDIFLIFISSNKIANVSHDTLADNLSDNLPGNLPKDVFFENLYKVRSKFIWIGPKTKNKDLTVHKQCLGSFELKNIPQCALIDHLYTGFYLLFAYAWKVKGNKDIHKVNICINLLKQGATIILSILNNSNLRKDIAAVFKNNINYDTAFFIGGLNGIGLSWVNFFDKYGKIIFERHCFGESIHGPIVTVDPNYDSKYVKLINKDEMIKLYGKKQVNEWEKIFLDSKDINDFLNESEPKSFNSILRPFFAGINWYLPILAQGYDTKNDNLIFIDATNKRYLAQVLDELSTYGCRYAKIVLITQSNFVNASNKALLLKHPISNIISIPSFLTNEKEIPISGVILPFAMNILAMAASSINFKEAIK